MNRHQFKHNILLHARYRTSEWANERSFLRYLVLAHSHTNVCVYMLNNETLWMPRHTLNMFTFRAVLLPLCTLYGMLIFFGFRYWRTRAQIFCITVAMFHTKYSKWFFHQVTIFALAAAIRQWLILNCLPRLLPQQTWIIWLKPLQ